MYRYRIQFDFCSISSIETVSISFVVYRYHIQVDSLLISNDEIVSARFFVYRYRVQFDSGPRPISKSLILFFSLSVSHPTRSRVSEPQRPCATSPAAATNSLSIQLALKYLHVKTFQLAASNLPRQTFQSTAHTSRTSSSRMSIAKSTLKTYRYTASYVHSNISTGVIYNATHRAGHRFPQFTVCRDAFQRRSIYSRFCKIYK